MNRTISLSVICSQYFAKLFYFVYITSDRSGLQLFYNASVRYKVVRMSSNRFASAEIFLMK